MVKTNYVKISYFISHWMKFSMRIARSTVAVLITKLIYPALCSHQAAYGERS